VRCLACTFLLVSACSADFELPSSGGANVPSVTLDPEGALDAAPAVFRLRVEGGRKRSALSDYRMFSGELGAYHLGRIRNRDLPATLVEREIAVLSWADDEDVVVAPLAVLGSGEYALVTPELGLVAEVLVDAALVPVLERVWPARDTQAGIGLAIFCGEAVQQAAPGFVALAPTGAPASILRGLDDDGAFSDRCLRLELTETAIAGTPLLPPGNSGGVLLEPRVLVVATEEVERTPCVEPELALGPTCGAVADDRMELRAYSAPAFVAFAAPHELVGVVSPGKSLVLRGFEPSSRTRVTGLAFDALGARVTIDVELTLASARPHLVLNEVLADPVGPETFGEWIELVNDGSRPIDLAEFVLDDALEPVALPPHELAPGNMVLLVDESYAPDPELDLVPPSDVAIVRLPGLGRNGLSNAGELFRLRDRDGLVVSRFPARKAPRAGASIARHAPDSPDDESGSFGEHAPPGASPGRDNVVGDE
jgi:hypothetical protein